MDASLSLDSPLSDTVAPRLGYMLRRASAVMMAGLGAALADMALRPVEGTILILVGENPGCIQSDIGRTLGIKRANMAPLVAGLAARGLLSKTPVDGRSLALTLTSEGDAARRQVESIMDAHEARFEALLNETDMAALRDALRIIAQQGESAPD
ncbi:MarR family transcriptional regulator [Sphingobium amiense]|uniref:MarR family transcriptional regulator n=1 Tax=Sphingobium amiense TaxID=135719 RepID=A0A494WEY7_9SPHN|nr:MarR family winged helix-turn-helix transcriptional regulator [Sphingobium amiense]BBD99530.1 MarR family transcriptional regulator [Sphingobium amiense]